MNGYKISEFMHGGRIASHGKITDLSNGFSLPGRQRFSIYIRPKEETDEYDTVLSVRCSHDDELSEAPVLFNDWTPLALIEIGADSEILNNYDIYWGSGTYIK